MLALTTEVLHIQQKTMEFLRLATLYRISISLNWVNSFSSLSSNEIVNPQYDLGSYWGLICGIGKRVQTIRYCLSISELMP